MKTLVIILNAIGALLLGFLIPSRIQIYAGTSFIFFVAILVIVIFANKRGIENTISASDKLIGLLALCLVLMGLFFAIRFYEELLHRSSYGEVHFFVMSSTAILLAAGTTTLFYAFKKRKSNP